MGRESSITTIFASRKLIQSESLCSFLSYHLFYPFLFSLFLFFGFSRCFHNLFLFNSPILTFIPLQWDSPSWFTPKADLALSISLSDLRLFFQPLSLNITIFSRFICNNTKHTLHFEGWASHNSWELENMSPECSGMPSRTPWNSFHSAFGQRNSLDFTANSVLWSCRQRWPLSITNFSSS